MERKDCVVCGASFPLTRPHRIMCSKKCQNARSEALESQREAAARRALMEPPLYNKTQLAEARHHIKLYDTPEKARGREYVLSKAKQIVEYWKKRDAMETLILRAKENSRKSTATYKERKKNDQTTQ
jgi:predicted nucleic acid-binding Zn ribbon protein